MKKKTVTQYSCDFCKKKNLSAGHMKKHESRCTMNPNRYCGICPIIGNPQPDLKDLIQILPDPKAFAKEDEYEHEYLGIELTGAVNAVWYALETEAGECPACIMAALRQGGIPVPMATKFNYKERVKELFDEKRKEESMEGVYP